MDIIEEFKSELTEGDIRFRDNLQFELKSEFFINPNLKKNTYKQEFFLFVPAALQINKQTYSKNQFYLDQTNLIRYKSPQISLRNLIRADFLKSPLIRLKKFAEQSQIKDPSLIADELKLFGMIFRTALRDRARLLLSKIKYPPSSTDWQKQVNHLCSDINNARALFLHIQETFLRSHSSYEDLKNQWKYTDEYVSETTEYYLTCLLKMIREMTAEDCQASDQLLCDAIIQEQEHRKKHQLMSKALKDHPHASEAILYRNSLLSKLMLEALLLNSSRHSLEEKHGPFLGAIAAGIAMMIYMLLIWQNSLFVINSLPFVFLIVILYVLKDRLKEGLKSFYYKQAFRWFPDYATEIKNRKGRIIGKLNENFSFMEEKQIPLEFLEMRNTDFHEELPGLRRQETIMHYKKEVILYQQYLLMKKRRRELTTIFRFNIHQFLQKASNALQPNLILNSKTLDIVERLLPKVYHINIIIRNTYLKSNLKIKIEIKKFRVVVDKFGIKRVEQMK